MCYSDFLKTIITEFIDDPDKLAISESVVDDVRILTITPANKEDVAKIIGRKGRTVSALRVILRAICNSKNSDSSDIAKIRVTVNG